MWGKICKTVSQDLINTSHLILFSFYISMWSTHEGKNRPFSSGWLGQVPILLWVVEVAAAGFQWKTTWLHSSPVKSIINSILSLFQSWCSSANLFKSLPRQWRTQKACPPAAGWLNSLLHISRYILYSLKQHQNATLELLRVPRENIISFALCSHLKTGKKKIRLEYK